MGGQSDQIARHEKLSREAEWWRQIYGSKKELADAFMVWAKQGLIIWCRKNGIKVKKQNSG